MKPALIAALSAVLLTFTAPLASAAPAPMPLVEVASRTGGDTLVVLYSGDGGWAQIDASLAAGFAHAGAPVVGVNSLRYFQDARTPEAAAADLAALIERYTRAWGRPKVILAGYSFGAGALPAIAERLPAQARAHVRLMALVGVAKVGELKFQPGDWLDIPAHDAYPIAPVLARLGPMPRVCVFGDRDPHDACADFGASLIRPVKVAGGHHYGGDYAPISAAILKSAGL